MDRLTISNTIYWYLSISIKFDSEKKSRLLFHRGVRYYISNVIAYDLSCCHLGRKLRNTTGQIMCRIDVVIDVDPKIVAIWDRWLNEWASYFSGLPSSKDECIHLYLPWLGLVHFRPELSLRLIISCSFGWLYPGSLLCTQTSGVG